MAERDTRAQILAVATELFARHGYQRTSLRQIADRLGVTKAAVLYHFAAKPDILAALIEPMLDDLDATLSGIEADADPDDPTSARWPTIEGMLDVLLAHRQAMRMASHDLAPLANDPAFHRFSNALTTAHRLVAGPDPDLACRVRAVQAIALLSDPVILLGDAPTDALREAILDGARQLFVAATPARAGRKVGRPAALTPEQSAVVVRMHADGRHTIEEIAAAAGVSRATLYRYLNRQ